MIRSFSVGQCSHRHEILSYRRDRRQYLCGFILLQSFDLLKKTILGYRVKRVNLINITVLRSTQKNNFRLSCQTG